MVLILLSVSLNALAQIFLRHGLKGSDFPSSFAAATDTILSPGVLGGIACYAISIIAWLAVLSRVQVSIAYPCQAFGYVLASAVAWQFLGESMTTQNMLGLALVCAGVIVLSRAVG